ncbi:NAD(P)/FAD-dependent oxidoreductase [Actinocorallia longicatena]|uniref:NAD(P)/FAD-dependent oxidoreductase n=1 Tax=Actinocorallia longicatena TaxID=111803 RepID=A0ABP6Q300_9ACTN
MSSPERYDVVIVGARCAGAATALLLARRGLRVLVLERGRRGSDTLSTHALMRGGVSLLHRWGLLERIAAAGTPPVRRVRFHYGAETVTVSLRSAAGVDALYAPRRTLLDAVLVDAAIAAGAEVRFGVTVTEVLQNASGRVTGVAARDRSGAGLRAESWLTVGADGARSLIARQVGARTLRAGTGASAIVYGYWSGLDVTGYEWFYRRGCAGGMIPTNGDEVCVFTGTPAGRFEREFGRDLRAGYLRLLAEATGRDGRLAGLEPPRRLRSFPGRPGFMREAWGAGWALTGDSGYFLDPLSSHGMTDSLRDAQLLARAVGTMLHGTPEDEALAGYQAVRDAVAEPVFAAADRIAGYSWDESTIGGLLREMSSAMSGEIEAVSRLGAR